MIRRKISADEFATLRKDHVIERGGRIGVAKGYVQPIEGTTKGFTPPKSWDPNERTARFIMSEEKEDRYGDIVRIKGIRMNEFMQNPVALPFHSSRSIPVGKWEDIAAMTRTRPPRLEGTIRLAPAGGPSADIETMAWAIENDLLRACSIGFIPDWEEAEGIFDDDKFLTGIDFIACDLLECSPCAIPANAGALAKSAESMPMALALIEEVLDTVARDPVTKLLIPRKDFEQKYFALARPKSLSIIGPGGYAGGVAPKGFTEVEGAEAGGDVAVAVYAPDDFSVEVTETKDADGKKIISIVSKEIDAQESAAEPGGEEDTAVDEKQTEGLISRIVTATIKGIFSLNKEISGEAIDAAARTALGAGSETEKTEERTVQETEKPEPMTEDAKLAIRAKAIETQARLRGEGRI